MKKFDFKSGLSFGVFMIVFGILQALWFTEIYTATTILRAVITGLLAGIFAGFLFGLFSGWYKSSRFAKKNPRKAT